MKKEEKNNKDNEYSNDLVKIIYYDEESAIDYVVLNYGGEITTEELKEIANTIQGNGSLKTKVEVKSPLFKLLNFGAALNLETKGDFKNNDIMKSTIKTNTMVEFIKLSNENTDVKVFRDYKLELPDKSATYFKAYLPYLKIFENSEMLNTIEELKDVDIFKLDEVLTITNGYYGFLARKLEDNTEYRECILRFNINCLKNNYKLTDLLDMNLTYFGIKVGTGNVECLNLETKLKNNSSNNNAENPCYENDFMNNKGNKSGELEIYDVILAGILRM